MSEDQFWDLITEAKAAVGSTKEIPAWLESRLLELSVEEITDFGAWLATFLDRSNDEKLWAAGSIISWIANSDDGFVYFQCWLIAQGKVVYKNALENPDSIGDMEFPESEKLNPSVNLERLLYVYGNAFNKKTGKPENTKVELPFGYQPPIGSQPFERTGRKNTGFLSQRNSATFFPKLTKRFKPSGKEL